MMKEKKMLYRKVNTKARGVYHNKGGDYKFSRRSKKHNLQKNGSMTSKKRGLDYTPLFKYLLSKVGNDWDIIFSEIKGRLDKTEPIFWMVALKEEDKQNYIRVGESTYWSTCCCTFLNTLISGYTNTCIDLVDHSVKSK